LNICGLSAERFSKMGKDQRAADKYWNRLRTKWWKMPAEWLDVSAAALSTLFSGIRVE
jgi:hypothetical protein